MNQKKIKYPVDENISIQKGYKSSYIRQISNRKKQAIELDLRISRLIFFTEKGVILADLIPNKIISMEVDPKKIVEAILICKQIWDPFPGRNYLKATNMVFGTLRAVILRYKHIFLCIFHSMNPKLEEYVKLFALYMLSQFKIRYPKEYFYKINEAAALEHPNSFQGLDIDITIADYKAWMKKLFGKVGVNTAGDLILKNVLIVLPGTKKVFFHHHFSEKKYEDLEFDKISNICDIVQAEYENLKESKGEKEINVIFLKYILHISLIPIQSLPEVNIAVVCVFKISFLFCKEFRTSDLGSIIGSRKYVTMHSQEENLIMFPFPGILEDVKRFRETLTVHLNHKDTQIEFNIEETKKQIVKNIAGERKSCRNPPPKEKIEKIIRRSPSYEEFTYNPSYKKTQRTLGQCVVLERSQSALQQDITSLLNKNKRKIRSYSFDITLIQPLQNVKAKVNPSVCLVSKRNKRQSGIKVEDIKAMINSGNIDGNSKADLSQANRKVECSISSFQVEADLLKALTRGIPREDHL